MRMRQWLWAAAIAGATLVSASSANAQDNGPDAGTKDWLAQPGGTVAPAVAARPEGPSTLRMAGLLVVVAALGGAAFYMKRKRSQVSERHGSPELAVVSSARLGPKSNLVLASVSGRLILLGVSETSVRKLAWVDDKPEKERAPETTRESASDPHFSRVLREILDEPDRERPEPARPAIRAPEPTPTVEPRRSLLSNSGPARLYSEAAPRVATSANTLAPSSRPVPSAPPERRSVPSTDLEGQVLGLARARKSRR